jgi:transcriptional regulator with PAS, ATPase and Fis domain
MTEPEPTPPEKDEPPVTAFRIGWTAFFQRSTDPLFVLDRRRRVRFVNHAWEALTGWSAERAVGRRCTRRPTREPSALLAALAPPADVTAGAVGRIRRPVPPAKAGPPWWDVSFVPFRDDHGVVGYLGRIQPAGSPGPRAPAGVPVFLRQRVAGRYGFDTLQSETAALRRVAEQARLAGQTRAPVWVTGPAGSGKRWLARVIHHQGVTREQVFLGLDCAGLPGPAVAAALFADPGLGRPERLGTLCLREPARLSRDLQLRLADWLAEREPTGPRPVACSRRPPAEDVRAGRLLDDLYQSLAVVTVELPPLCDRLADLPALAERFLERARRPGGAAAALTEEALGFLRSYDWPGNLRELGEVLAGAARTAEGGRITPGDLPASLRQAVERDRVPRRPREPVLLLDDVLEQVELRLIRQAVALSGGNQAEAARRLGVWRQRLARRMKELGLGGKGEAGPEPGPAEEPGPE